MVIMQVGTTQNLLEVVTIIKIYFGILCFLIIIGISIWLNIKNIMFIWSAYGTFEYILIGILAFTLLILFIWDIFIEK